MVGGSCCCRRSLTAASLGLATCLHTYTSSWNGALRGRSLGGSGAECAIVTTSSSSTWRVPQQTRGNREGGSPTGLDPSSSLLILHHADDILGVHDQVFFPSNFTSVPEYLAKTTTSPALTSTSSETPPANFRELRKGEVQHSPGPDDTG